MSGIVDYHVHTAPSLVPRHHHDDEIGAEMAAAGVGTYVLKAHEGSTAARAVLAGGGAIGSIVLNSPVGGANPDAVSVAARLGARVVWMPTVSAEAHQAASGAAELQVHAGLAFAPVPVCRDGAVLPAWNDVLDVVAEHDLVLASGHLATDEAVTFFRAARARGVQRLLLTHPLLPFLGWRDEHVAELVALGAHVEVGVLADLLHRDDDVSATVRLARLFPRSLLVFGSDLGHSDHPDVRPGLDDWLEATAHALSGAVVDDITTTNGKELLRP